MYDILFIFKYFIYKVYEKCLNGWYMVYCVFRESLMRQKWDQLIVRIFANLIKDINIRGWLSPRPNEAIPREGLVSLLNPQSKRSQKHSGKTVAKVGKWDLSTETSAQKIQNDIFNVLCLKNKQNKTKRNKDKPVNCSRKSAFRASCRAAVSWRVFFRAVGITQQEEETGLV